MRKAVRYFVLLFVLFFVIAAISADEDQSIAVRNNSEEFSSTATDGTTTVVNGFDVDWPVSLDVTYISRRFGGSSNPPIPKEELAAAFPEYYEDLADARRGAELVNEFAFDTYKKIAGDGEDKLFFSPYGVYTALWEIRELWESETQNNIFNGGDIDLFIRKLRKMIYVNFINKFTKREEDEHYSSLFYRHPSSFDLLYPHPAFDQFYLHHHPSFDLTSSIDRARSHLPYISQPKSIPVIEGNLPVPPELLMARVLRAQIDSGIDMLIEYRESSFNVSNSVSTYKVNSFQKYDTSLSLMNSTSLDIPVLNYGSEAFLTTSSIRWNGGSFLYTQTDEFELMRIRFFTLKHSLLLINPKKTNDFKKIEREINIKMMKNLLLNMELKNCVFRPFLGLFSDYREEKASYTETVLELDLAGITKGTPLVNFNHNVSLLIAKYLMGGEDRLTHPVTLKNLYSKYDHVIPFDHPFLFFVIDDPTGAILIMGRSPGHGPEKE
jgi:hypothetical protein